jgi:hypothetical protein
MNATRITATILGIYAGLLGIAHGYFEVRQGSIPAEGVMIQAIGAPCQPDAVATASAIGPASFSTAASLSWALSSNWLLMRAIRLIGADYSLRA